MSRKQELQIPFSIIVAGFLIAASIYISSTPDRGLSLLRRKGGSSAAPSSPAAERGKGAIQPSRDSASDSNRAGSLPNTYTVSVDDDPFLGRADAPITMIEFSDFECPFCGRFFTNTLPQLKRDYIDTGKLKFVYRDLPLHEPGSTEAAAAAQCAADQGKFWPYHDKLFEEFAKGGKNTPENLKTYAAELGLNQADFAECVDGKKYYSEVSKDNQDARALGVTGTPTLFIGKTTGQKEIVAEKIVGAQPTATFTSVIDRLLKE